MADDLDAATATNLGGAKASCLDIAMPWSGVVVVILDVAMSINICAAMGESLSWQSTWVWLWLLTSMWL